MKWFSTHRHPDELFFIIEDDPSGYYVYVYAQKTPYEQDLPADEDCIQHQQDHHQDDLPMAKRFALHQFGVPMDSWVDVESGKR